MEISIELGATIFCILGPILFVVYINDLEEGVICKILKFADGTKLFRKLTKLEINKNNYKMTLINWSGGLEKWQILFNFGKCKCLHTGPWNTATNCEMGGTILSKTMKEKYLGLTMYANKGKPVASETEWRGTEEC